METRRQISIPLSVSFVESKELPTRKPVLWSIECNDSIVDNLRQGYELILHRMRLTGLFHAEVDVDSAVIVEHPGFLIKLFTAKGALLVEGFQTIEQSSL